MRKLFKVLLALVFLAVALCAFFYIKNATTEKPIPEIHGLLLPETKGIPPFALQEADGSSFTEKNFMGHWSFVFFGYTHCPDICPMTLSILNHAWKELALKKDKNNLALTDNLQVVFISVDPSRDNLNLLKQYVNYFNPAFIGVTGNDTQLSMISKYFGIVYNLVANKNDNPDNYLVNHGSAINIINPKGEYQGFFSAPHNTDAITDDFVKIHDYWQP